MKNKNILIFCISLNRGGAERVVSLLLKEFTSLDNVNIHLVMLEDAIAYELPKAITPIILSKSHNNGVYKFLELPLIAYKLAQYIKVQKIETVLSFLYRPNYINILAKLFGAKHKAVINIRSTTSRYLNEGLLGKINLFLIKSLFNKSDLIISNSLGVDEDLKKIMDIRTQTKVINNPLDLDFIEKEKLICRDIKFKFDKNIRYVISLGRLIPLKRNKDLIDAFYELQKQDETIKLIFLGDGSMREELQSYCKSLNILNKVDFLGDVTNPFYYLAKSDLFVLNSQTEGFPNVLIEAMASGIPVISSDCKSGPREILKGGKYGYLYPVGDIKLLIEKMKKVLYSNLDITRVKNMNKERVFDFRVEKIMKKFTEVL